MTRANGYRVPCLRDPHRYEPWTLESNGFMVRWCRICGFTQRRRVPAPADKQS